MKNNTSFEKIDKKNYHSLSTVIFIVVFLSIFIGISRKMGFVNMINTIMNSSYHLLINTCFYILSIAVLTGGLSKLLSEFYIIDLINDILSIFMRPLYGLPGSASLGVITCYLSDNPAILTLTNNVSFVKYFKKYQLPALTNLATSFGMGIIVTTTIMSMDIEGAVNAAIIGNIGAVIGSVVSVRLMLIATKKYYGEHSHDNIIPLEYNKDSNNLTENKSIFDRIINPLLEGGSEGVKLGVQIIPGVLIICTIVMLLTNGEGDNGMYNGAYNEGITFLPMIGKKLEFILNPLFGFSSPESISVPITALGSAGAAIALIPDMIKNNLITSNDLCVFNAMYMCWSGYLSTHIAMMDALNTRELTKNAIISHTIGGLVAGVSANILFKIMM